MSTVEDIGRAVTIAHQMGRVHDDALFKEMTPAELWASILEERANAASWRPACEELAWLIDERVKRLERLLTEKLAMDASKVGDSQP